MICGMESIISLISIVNPVRDRHRPVCRDVEPQDELLQVWSMVFVFSIAQQLRSTPPTILPGNGDCGGVMVNLRAFKIKDLDCSQGQPAS